MANITLLGASYTDVPAVDLPATGGGTARFHEVSGSQSITTNGTYDVTTKAEVVVNVSGGGGATNLIQGSFTLTQDTEGAYNITIPYNGTGYPIAAMIFPAGGPYNPGEDFYTTINRYAVSCWMLCKSVQDVASTYQTSGTANQGTVVTVYKSSTTNASSYNRGGGQNTNIYSSAAADGGTAPTVARFKNATTMSLYMKTAGSNQYGFAQNVTYDYIVVYSK